MNIWQRNRKYDSQNKIKIKSESMLTAYQTYKSIELHLQGRFDYTKYSKLKNLSEESFNNESGDLKMAVQIIFCNTDTKLDLLNMCLVVAMNHVENSSKRSDSARTYLYHDIIGKSYVKSGGATENPFKLDIEDSWLHDNTNLHVERFNKLFEWVIKPFTEK